MYFPGATFPEWRALSFGKTNSEIPEPGFPNKISDCLLTKFYGLFVLRAIALHMRLSSYIITTRSRRIATHLLAGLQSIIPTYHTR